MKPYILHPSQDIVGEGVIYLETLATLLWIDIESALLHCLCGKEYRCCKFEKRITSIIPYHGSQVWITMSDELVGFDIDSWQTTQRIALPFIKEGFRTNDCKAAPDGSLWLGVMHLTEHNHNGYLYRLSPSGEVDQMLCEQSIPNGIVWNSQADKLYYADSGRGVIEEYHYTPNSAKIELSRILVTIPKEYGIPDGMTIDSEDNIWAAHWGGGGVYVWSCEDGALLEKIELEVENVASCTFGDGKLFMTTARAGISEQGLLKIPTTGYLFAIETSVKGGNSNFSFTPESFLLK